MDEVRSGRGRRGRSCDEVRHEAVGEFRRNAKGVSFIVTEDGFVAA